MMQALPHVLSRSRRWVWVLVSWFLHFILWRSLALMGETCILELSHPRRKGLLSSLSDIYIYIYIYFISEIWFCSCCLVSFFSLNCPFTRRLWILICPVSNAFYSSSLCACFCTMYLLLMGTHVNKHNLIIFHACCLLSILFVLSVFFFCFHFSLFSSESIYFILV